MERLLPLARLWPDLANAALHAPLGRRLLASAGLVDLPAVSPWRERARRLDLAALQALPAERKARAVILVPDTFTESFDAAVPRSAEALLRRLGYAVHRAPLCANGKALHNLGFLARYARTARAARRRHAAYAATGVAVVGLEAVTVLMDRHEYAEAGGDGPPPVRTLDEFLAAEIAAGRLAPRRAGVPARPVSVLLHCTEKTALPAAAARWEAILGSE